jgi:prepilin-type N-terminal cleavage/methylation domain-containing protein
MRGSRPHPREHGKGRSPTEDLPGFTLIELLVVIAIIALLMSILMPSLTRVKKQARTVACLANLKQWGLFFSMYAEDNSGRFMKGFPVNNRAVQAMRVYHKCDAKVTCCPNATKECYDESGAATGREGTFLGSTAAWGYYSLDSVGTPLKGSYGINGYCNDPEPGKEPHSRPAVEFWRGPSAAGAAYVPLWVGALRYNGWPLASDTPPAHDGDVWNDNAQMGRYCMNRHDGFVNALFLDYGARKVGVKELWTLRWHKSYLKTGPWTKAGGVLPSDWPEWMRPFREY